jgi:hypothetical protein
MAIKRIAHDINNLLIKGRKRIKTIKLILCCGFCCCCWRVEKIFTCPCWSSKWHWAEELNEHNHFPLY